MTKNSKAFWLLVLQSKMGGDFDFETARQFVETVDLSNLTEENILDEYILFLEALLDVVEDDWLKEFDLTSE